MKKSGYQPRSYRSLTEHRGLTAFQVTYRESDLYVRAALNLEKEALEILKGVRLPLEEYGKAHPLFLSTLKPYPLAADMPEIVRIMAEAARAAGVGPMAAVAGAVAELTGRELLKHSPEVIVENGGDIFLKVNCPARVGIYAGDSPLSLKIGLEVEPEDTPLGVCTSSGTVGHSLSLGTADAVVILSRSTALADATATAAGNRIKDEGDMEANLEWVQKIPGISGVVIVKGERLGGWGKVKLAAL